MTYARTFTCPKCGSSLLAVADNEDSVCYHDGTQMVEGDRLENCEFMISRGIHMRDTELATLRKQWAKGTKRHYFRALIRHVA